MHRNYNFISQGYQSTILLPISFSFLHIFYIVMLSFWPVIPWIYIFSRKQWKAVRRIIVIENKFLGNHFVVKEQKVRK